MMSGGEFFVILLFYVLKSTDQRNVEGEKEEKMIKNNNESQTQKIPFNFHLGWAYYVFTHSMSLWIVKSNLTVERTWRYDHD